ncbi:PQQ-dependent sugar dehydrogenase [Methylobacterium sp. Leaf466]|uniref:PQQ-dependent sugar dehydrogenase n=1 Tax=Methylobacterium sp. Leaf466 TaxID=1736386 RepID=UPI0006FF79B5|nr:PQQ-dependent sugar dehydrogenase [Methylobacterium sp. Leaf466]KQT80611.1 oxidoreductase [Methylobacterium sp. Leaf466]
MTPARRPTRLALAFTLSVASLPALAQALQTPGSTRIEANVVKAAPLEATPERIASLKLPPGFRIAPFATGLGAPRVIVVAPDGALYVSDRDAGTVTRIEAGDGAKRKVVLTKPDVHGLAIHEGRLFYVTVKEIFSAPLMADGGLGPERRLVADLPDAGQHPNRTIAVGPDGWLYASLGSTCNECEERNPENATMVRMKPDGSGREIVASGLRNTIGFDWEPTTKALYGWDDGVDWHGDDETPEELNRIEPGKKYGWPYIFGNGMKNLYREVPKSSLEQWDKDSERPVLTWTAHASSMQFAFYRGGQFPAEYRGDAFVTMHGSWNRKPPSGYEVLRVRFDKGRPVSIEPFVSGFLTEGGPSGWSRFARPFGLAVAKDGSLYLGDDQHGIVYRISHEG